MPFAILQSERLTFRELTPDDLDFVAEMLGDPEVMRYYPKCYSRSEAQVWLDRQRQRYRYHGFGLWLVSDRQTGQPLGQVGLLIQDVDDRFEPEVGYLIHRPYWRQGYAFEAASRVLQFARQDRGFQRVISLIRPENIPSQGVARKLGATVEKEVEFKGLRHFVFVHAGSSGKIGELAEMPNVPSAH